MLRWSESLSRNRTQMRTHETQNIPATNSYSCSPVDSYRTLPYRKSPAINTHQRVHLSGQTKPNKYESKGARALHSIMYASYNFEDPENTYVHRNRPVGYVTVYVGTRSHRHRHRHTDKYVRLPIFSTKPAEPVSLFEDKLYFPDLPDGPLTEYRSRATFDYKKMALLLETEESYRLKVSVLLSTMLKENVSKHPKMRTLVQNLIFNVYIFGF